MLQHGQALKIMLKESESEVAQSCPTLCNPMDCSRPHSSLHGILQARILEWEATFFSTEWVTWAKMQDVSRALLPSGASRGKNLLPCLFQLLELPTFFGWWPFLYLQSQQHCSFAALWLFSHSHMLLHYLGVLQWISLLKTKDISKKKKKKRFTL